MKKILFRSIAVIWLGLCSCAALAQTNITRVEYYVDADPGYGNANAASISAAPELSTSFNIATGTLTPGLHIVGIRSRDANGTWSMDERWLILQQAVTATTPNIDRAEWYVDVDPGYGNATAINITSGQDIASLSFQYNTGSLQPGLHIIGVRSRNTNGTWSMDERWLVLKPEATASTDNLERVEWYADKDPGYGKGFSIPIPAGQTDISNLSLQALTDTLQPGLHLIGIRSQSTTKAWSFDERWLLLKSEPTAANSTIQRVEWYVDKDPGYGLATPISIMPGQDLVNLSFSTFTDTLQPGLHIAGIRSKAANGAWSFDERWLILKQPAIVTLPDVKRLEYYIDSDPGKGKGIPVAFLPAKDVVAPLAFINVTGLDTGRHKLLIRSQDANNVWSFDDTLSFAISTKVAAPFINVNSVAATNVCAAGSFTLGYHATGIYNNGNKFIAEISDSTGSFTVAQEIGNLISTDNGGLIACNMPQGISGGNGYRMRVRSTNPPLTGNGSNQSLSVSLSSFFLGADTFKVVACAEQRVDITQFYNPANSMLTWSIATPTAAPVGVYTVFATNAIGCKDTATVTVSLPIAIWTGAVSSNWHTPGNWNINAVPADTTHVIIPPETANECIISVADAVAASVHVKAGASAVRITNNRKLLIKAACGSVPD